MPLDFGALRRHPDVEGRGLEASDAADRLILDEATELIAGVGPGKLVVIDDGYGATRAGSGRGGGARDPGAPGPRDWRARPR